MNPGNVFRHFQTSFVAVLLCAAAACSHAAPLRYQIRDIGVLPGGYGTVGADINNLGEITANASTSAGELHAVLYQGRRLHDIGVLPGFPQAFPYAINDRTEIVGTQYGGSLFGTPGITGFLYTHGELLDLETVMGVEGWTYPVDINNHGHIVGSWYQEGISTSDGFVFANGTFTLLPRLVPNGPIYPFAINDAGDIVGSMPIRDTFYDFRAILIRNGQVQNLGVLPDTVSSVAYGLNDRGTIVGGCLGPAGFKGFVYRNGAMTDVGALPGLENTSLWQVNNHEQIVGGCFKTLAPGPIVPVSRAIVISDGVMHDLNDLIPPGSRWLLTNASAINDHGEIMARGEPRYGGFQRRTFLLTPLGQAR
jgi:uncharacterized membrane protein